MGGKTSGGNTPIDKNDFSFRENGEIEHFDFAYITIHGTPGEDGRLQGYFDMIRNAVFFLWYVCKRTYIQQVCLQSLSEGESVSILPVPYTFV